jgi:hypothetical protein
LFIERSRLSNEINLYSNGLSNNNNNNKQHDDDEDRMQRQPRPFFFVLSPMPPLLILQLNVALFSSPDSSRFFYFESDEIKTTGAVAANNDGWLYLFLL